jgi:hypothetical protein
VKESRGVPLNHHGEEAPGCEGDVMGEPEGEKKKGLSARIKALFEK